MKISVLTPTCDRPIAFALCERYMARQTLKPDQWIVADGGKTAANCTMGQIHLHDPHPPGASNFARNLLNGLAAASGALLILWEDDDLYTPTHIESIAAKATAGGSGLIGTERIQRYYNVASRCWRIFNNVGASLSQTAIARPLWPIFRETVQKCMDRNSYGIDGSLWGAAPRDWAFTHEMTCVGIKGLPGGPGLGVGHRPDLRWTRDPDLSKLREWVGEDAANYADFASPQPQRRALETSP